MPADINPIWNDNFSIHNIGIDDVVEFTVMDYGVLAQSHVGGFGPMKVARCILKVGESGFEGWLEMTGEIAMAGATFGEPVLYVRARFALLQGSLPPLGLVTGVTEMLTHTAPDLSASAALQGSWSSGVVDKPNVNARQALQEPSAPPRLRAHGRAGSGVARHGPSAGHRGTLSGAAA